MRKPALVPSPSEPDLLSAIAARHGVQRPAAFDETFEERAGILEFEAGLPRAAAERFARRLVALGPNPPSDLLRQFDTDITAEEVRHHRKT